MYVLIKNPTPTAPVFAVALEMLVPNVYNDLPTAQGDATTLATANPGTSYTVFELVVLGTALLTPDPLPPATWTAVTSPVA